MTAFRPGGDAPAAEPLAASAVGGNGARAVPDATLIDLSAERRARASPSQTLEQAIEAVDRQIAALMAEPDGPDKLRVSAALFREKASLLGKRDRALAAEAKEAKRATTQPAARGRPTAEEAAAAEAALHADIRRLLARHDLHYVEATDCWWKLGASGAWTPMKEHAVRLIAAPMRDPEYFAEFCEVMRADGRWYEAMTASFRPQPPHVLNTLRPDFCPLVEGGGEPHEMFGHLIASLGGGKAENIEHIERLLLAKYLNPANHLLPALVIDDPEGGAGKGLFVSNLLPTVFGAALVADNLSMADITGRFTAHTAGKAIVYVNESVEDRVDDNALKRVLGSPTLWVEPKGLQKYEVDNTALMIVSGNGVAGAVRVANSTVDRRYSIVRPVCPIADRLAAAFGVPVEDAKLYLREEGVRVLNDRVEVGLWLADLRRRHGDVRHVEPLHGEDYRALTEVQAPFHDQVFEAVFGAEDFSHIGRPVLYTLYRELCRSHNSGYGLMGNRKFYAHLDVWAKRRRLAVRVRNVNRQKGGALTTADVFVLDGTAAADDPRLPNNDNHYVVEDPATGKLRCRVEVS